MATITPTRIATPHDDKVQLWLWETVTSDDTCLPVVCAGFQDKSIQVIGNFGTNAVATIQGSLIKDSPTYATLDDANDNDLAITAAGIEEITAAVYQIRPAVTLGTAEDLDIYLYMER